MKLKKSYKSLIAYVVAIAMVVTSMVGYQAQSVSADTDYSALTYKTATCDNGETIYYSVVSNSLVGLNENAIWYGDGGVTLQLAFAGGDFNPEGNLVVTVNGVETTSGVVALIGTGLVKLNPTQMANNAYTDVIISNVVANTSCEIVIKKGTPGDNDNDESSSTEESSSVDESSSVEESTSEESSSETQLQWSATTDGLNTSTITNTSTADAYGITFEGFSTDMSWGGDSKWQGQAVVNDIPVTVGQAYNLTVDVAATPAKQILVQTNSGEYTEVTSSSEEGSIKVNFVAKAAIVNVVIAFGAMSAEEVGTYDIAISNMKIAEAELSDEQKEEARVQALFTSDANIALNKTATASSTAAADAYLAKETFDGNLQSRWAAGSVEAGEWIAVDLGAVYDITSVAMAWEGAYAKEYIIQVSEDGETYTDALTVTATKAETVEKEITATGQFVRIYCVSNGLPYPYSIWEIAVLGTPASGEVTTPEETPTTPEETPTTPEETPTTPEVTTPEVTTPSAEPSDNLLANAEWVPYVGADWTWCNGTLTVDNGVITGDFATTGGGWTGAEWGIQATATPTVEVGATYVYSSTITATKDMTIRVKIGKASDDSEISYEPIALKAGETYTYSKEFTSDEATIKIVYACAGGEEGAVTDVVFTISDNKLVKKVEETTTPEATTPQPTEKPTVKPTVKPTTVAPTTKAPTVKTTSIKKITRTKDNKKAKITLRKASGVTGYKIQYSRNKKFKKGTVKNVKTKKLNVTIKGLKSNKKYYFRVIAYKKVGKKVYYSQKWSKVKTLNVRKK